MGNQGHSIRIGRKRSHDYNKFPLGSTNNRLGYFFLGSLLLGTNSSSLCQSAVGQVCPVRLIRVKRSIEDDNLVSTFQKVLIFSLLSLTTYLKCYKVRQWLFLTDAEVNDDSTRVFVSSNSII